MDRSREMLVKFMECFHFGKHGQIDPSWKLPVLGDDLVFEALEKPVHVEFILQASQPSGGRIEIAGNRNTNGGKKWLWTRTVHMAFSGIFESQISAQAETDQSDFFPVVFIHGPLHDAVEVIGCAAVVEAEAAVELAGTTAEIPADHSPSRIQERLDHALHVGGPGTALQAV